MVALKGPVVSVRLDAQSTPPPLTLDVKSPQPSLTSQCTCFFCAAVWKTLKVELGSRKCRVWRRTRGELESVAKVCWMLRPGEAEMRGWCGCTERCRICKRISALHSTANCWDGGVHLRSSSMETHRILSSSLLLTAETRGVPQPHEMAWWPRFSPQALSLTHV